MEDDFFPLLLLELELVEEVEEVEGDLEVESDDELVLAVLGGTAKASMVSCAKGKRIYRNPQGRGSTLYRELLWSIAMV